MAKKLTLILMVVVFGFSLLFVNGCEDNTQAERDSLRREMNTVTVNVTNSNGSVIQIKLARQGPGYIGPSGEYYDKLPTEEQLRPVYGF